MEDQQLDRMYCIDCGNTFYPHDANPACASCSTAFNDLAAERKITKRLRDALQTLADGESCYCSDPGHNDCGICVANAALEATS